MNVKVVRTFFAFGCLSLAFACGSSKSVDAPVDLPSDTPGDPSPNPPTDGDSGSTGTPDAAGPRNHDTDEPAGDVSCDAVAPDAEDGVFVAVTGSDGDTCGTPTDPCKSISKSVNQAHKAFKSNVYAARGTYAERVQLQAGVKVIGGWKIVHGAWSRVCTSPESAVVVQPAANDTTALEAKDLGGETTVQYLRVTGKPQVGPGESVYGLVASGDSTSVRLDHVSIDVGNAGAGKDGAIGAAGSAPLATCPVGAGAQGTAGTAGTAAKTTIGPRGFVVTEATSGTDGTDGANSPDGAPGVCSPCGSCNGLCFFQPSGSGETTCGGPGGRGCGGGGGKGGAAGTSGGSAIGIFAWDAQIAFTTGSISAGDGGNGGKGGGGGEGKKGTVGPQGTTGTKICLTSCKGLIVSCQENKTGGPGGEGGVGGNGGGGGDGGSGDGGSSFAIYQGGVGFVSLTDATLKHGKAGTGGAGKIPGEDGTEGDRNQ